MSISSKLASALKGGVREAAEGVIDANSIRILGQEIHEFENDIADSKQKLALIITQAMQVERQIAQAQTTIEEKEQEVASLLSTDNEDAAIVIAEEIGDLESKIKQLKKHQVSLRTHEQSLKTSLKNMISHLDTYKNEYNMAKANENMQKAQGKLAKTSHKGSNRFADIESSLERVQSRQQETSDQMEAMEDVEASLGITPTNSFKEASPSAAEVLKRIKEKQV